MQKLLEFCNSIAKSAGDVKSLDIPHAREVVKEINDFLFANYDGIGFTEALGRSYEYFSDFHKFWEKHNREIIGCEIDENACERVADALHDIYLRTEGMAFKEIYDRCGLTDEEVCTVRMLSANQDFRGSLKFEDLAKIFKSDPSIFDLEHMASEPGKFLEETKVANLSQNDKRKLYAEKIAKFYLEQKCEPYEILSLYDYDLLAFRSALINYIGAGFGNKKADMAIRDMIVMGIWKKYIGFESIDVASDSNTMQIALRTGIIKTAIPLVTSFLDIFCYQYSFIDEMNAKAWRVVWEKWKQRYPNESIESPCLLDFFIYSVIGKQFCKPALYIFQCEQEGHTFKWHSSRNRTCQVCYEKNKKRYRAHIIEKRMPCCDLDGKIAILNSKYVNKLPNNQKFDKCPFFNICVNKYLKSPKSISIEGQTGWVDAYTKIGEGGGGLMA